jgi:hypothetical protein
LSTYRITTVVSVCLHKNEQMTQMLAQQPVASKEAKKLPDQTKRGVLEYILHHRDQKFSIYCNNNNQGIFGLPGTDFRFRVLQFQQDLLRPRNRSRLDILVKKYASDDGKETEKIMMLRSAALRKKAPTKAAKGRSILKNKAASDAHDGFHLDDEDNYDDEEEYNMEYVSEGRDAVPPRNAMSPPCKPPRAPLPGPCQAAGTACKFLLNAGSRATAPFGWQQQQ